MWGIVLVKKDDPDMGSEWGIWEARLGEQIIGEIHNYSHPYPVFYLTEEPVISLTAMKQIVEEWDKLNS